MKLPDIYFSKRLPKHLIAKENGQLVAIAMVGNLQYGWDKRVAVTLPDQDLMPVDNYAKRLMISSYAPALLEAPNS